MNPPTTCPINYLAHSPSPPLKRFFYPGSKDKDSTKKQKRPSQALADLFHLSHAKVPTRTLNNQQHAKKARQNTHRQKKHLPSAPSHTNDITRKKINCHHFPKKLFPSHGADKAKDDSGTTPEDVLARKIRQTGGASPPCSGPGRPRTRVRSAKSFPRTARNSEQRDG